MAWSSGSFTRVRGSASWTTDYNNNTGIEPGLHDTNDQDLAVGINNCIAKDGQNAATGNLDLGGNKLTNVGNATNAQDAVTLSQAQAGIDTQGTGLSINATRFSNDANGPQISLRKSRGATVGTNTIVQNNDNLGFLVWSGANGTGYTSAASINAAVDGTPGASNDMPGRLLFSTTADGSGTLSERMRIDSSGRVGIGTGVPLTRTTVVGAGQDGAITDAGNKEAALRVSATSGNAGGGGQIEFGAGYGTFTQSYFAGIKGLLTNGGSNSAGDLAIYTRRAITDTGLTEAMRIDSSGRVGIGIAAPSQRLHISDGTTSGDVRTLIGETNTLELIRNGSTDASVRTNINILYLDNTKAGSIIAFRTNASERMRITDGGKINFHSTTTTNTAGECYFSSVPATEPPTLTFAKTFSGNRNVLLNYHNGTYIGGVDMSNTATAFPTSSDYRLKENIAPMADALNRINQLKPVRFNFISDPNNEIDGFLAHEVAEVVPNAVFGEKDGVNEDGTMFVQSLDHSKLIPLLAGAIQELSAKVEALEAQLAS